MMANKPNNVSVVDYAFRLVGQLVQIASEQCSWRCFCRSVWALVLRLFLEYLDDTVRSTDEVERLLHLPALAVIPAASGAIEVAGWQRAAGLQKRNGH